MSDDSPLAIVLAAGKGTRMQSELPKVLSTALGRPLVEYVVDALHAAGVRQIVAVVGYRADAVQAALASRGVQFAEQSQQLGTGHAVLMCQDYLQQHDGPVVILAGDSPMVQPQSLRSLLQRFQQTRPACLLGTLEKEDPDGLGRIVRDDAGNFAAIVEQKDATDAERAIKEVNMSTYVFNAEDLRAALLLLSNRNRQQEYYLTDCPGILLGQGKLVLAEPVLQSCEALSVNTAFELRQVEQAMRELGYPATA